MPEEKSKIENPKSKMEIISIGDLKSLLSEIQKKQTVRFTLLPSKKRARFGTAIDDIVEAGALMPPGTTVLEINLRPLSEDEMAAADAIMEAIVPPRKPPAPGAATGTVGELDFDDKEYNNKLTAADFMRTAFLIEKSIDGFKLDGEDLEAKASFLKKTFPRRIIKFLGEQVEAISANDIRALDLALFTSNAG